MLNNKNNVLLQLYRLGLSADEAKVYLALLEEPMSHLGIARRTGVNRSKVYRIADELEKRGLITENQDETGKQLLANDPANLFAVQASVNRDKGASGPLEWLPPAAGFHCQYVTRFIRVAKTYQLVLSTDEGERLGKLHAEACSR